MPIYEYNCKKCGKKFEKLVMDNREKVKCPHCDSETLEKLFSQFGASSGKSSSQGPCGSGGCCPGCKRNP